MAFRCILDGMGIADGHPDIRVDHWPIAIIECPERFSDDAVVYLAACFQHIFARGEKFAVLVDTARLRQVPGAHWRQELATWLNDPGLRARATRHNVGAAIVIDSEPVRGALTALHWLWTPPTPQVYPADMRGAAEWCIERLRASGVAIGPRLHSFRLSLAKPTVKSR